VDSNLGFRRSQYTKCSQSTKIECRASRNQAYTSAGAALVVTTEVIVTKMAKMVAALVRFIPDWVCMMTSGDEKTCRDAGLFKAARFSRPLQNCRIRIATLLYQSIENRIRHSIRPCRRHTSTAYPRPLLQGSHSLEVHSPSDPSVPVECDHETIPLHLGPMSAGYREHHMQHSRSEWHAGVW
jgi:hypothetical protein